MSGAMMAGGAAMVIVGTIGAESTSKPDLVNVLYPEPTPQETEISKLQLEAARKLRGQIDDPRILEDIYSQLPETKMSVEDRAAFTAEYAQIKGQVATVALQQTGMAMGQELDDMVSRGAMSQEGADRQRAKNQAAISAVTKIYNKKLDAARIGMARNQYLEEGKTGLGAVSAIKKVDDTNRRIYNSVMANAIGNFEKRQKSQVDFYFDQALKNMEVEMGAEELRAETMRSSAATLAGGGSSVGSSPGGWSNLNPSGWRGGGGGTPGGSGAYYDWRGSPGTYRP